MVITDIDLTPRQAAEFIAWLDERADARERAALAAQQGAERDAETAAYNDRCTETLIELARDTARQSGPVVGVRDYDLSRAAWAAFIEHEGWHDPFDIDQYWQGDADDAETWEYTYVGELETIRSERKARGD